MKRLIRFFNRLFAKYDVVDVIIAHLNWDDLVEIYNRVDSPKDRHDLAVNLLMTQCKAHNIDITETQADRLVDEIAKRVAQLMGLVGTRLVQSLLK